MVAERDIQGCLSLIQTGNHDRRFLCKHHLDDEYRDGVLKVETRLKNNGQARADGYSVEMVLLDATESLIGETSAGSISIDANARLFLNWSCR